MHVLIQQYGVLGIPFILLILGRLASRWGEFLR